MKSCKTNFCKIIYIKNYMTQLKKKIYMRDNSNYLELARKVQFRVKHFSETEYYP